MSRRPKPLVVQVMEQSATRNTARLVLLGYAWFGDPDGSGITASPKGVAEKAGISVSTLERYRPRLLELGELVVVARDSHGEHAKYRIELPAQNPQPAKPEDGQNPQVANSERRQDPQQRRQVADSPNPARARGPNPVTPGEDTDVSPRHRSEPPRADVERLCEQLAQLVVENGSPAHLVSWPSDGWRHQARLLLDRDERDPAEAEHLIRWCQSDEFWRANVRGMPAFRKQYDTLRLQESRRGLAALPSGGRMSKADRVDAEVHELLRRARPAGA